MIDDISRLVEEYITRDPVYPSSLPDRYKRISALTGILESCCEFDFRDDVKEAAIRKLLGEIIVECTRFMSGLDDDKEIMLMEVKEDTCEAGF